mgnify:CR=1 FL=1
MRDVKDYSQRRPSYRRKLLNLNEIDVYTFKSPVVPAMSNITLKEELHIAGNLLMSQI